MEQPARRTAGVPEPWDDTYRDVDTPPAWDIGRPQPAFVALADAAMITEPVLDIGCGTGENSLMLAGRGLAVVGVDWAPTAVARALRKAADRGLQVTFEVRDALDLSSLGGERFATAIDSGLYHVFEPDEARRYAASVRGVLRPGGRFYVLCFSDREPDWGGPYRISQPRLRESFAEGWTVASIDEATFATRSGGGSARAWLGTLVRS